MARAVPGVPGVPVVPVVLVVVEVVVVSFVIAAVVAKGAGGGGGVGGVGGGGGGGRGRRRKRRRSRRSSNCSRNNSSTPELCPQSMASTSDSRESPRRDSATVYLRMRVCAPLLDSWNGRTDHWHGNILVLLLQNEI